MRNTEPARIVRIRPSRLQWLALVGVALLRSMVIPAPAGIQQGVWAPACAGALGL